MQKDIVEESKKDKYVKEILSKEKVILCKEVDVVYALKRYSPLMYFWLPNPGWGLPGKKYLIETENHIIFLDKFGIIHGKMIGVGGFIISILLIILFPDVNNLNDLLFSLSFVIFFVIISIIHGYYGFTRKFNIAIWEKSAIKKRDNKTMVIDGKLLNRHGKLEIEIKL